MKEKLNELLKNAYAPYSNYKVAAIIKAKDNKEFIGVNVENASYGATICAERNAINNAIANGYTKDDFTSIHVKSSKGFAYPCMICRQTFVELLNDDVIVTIYSDNDNKEFMVKELCPVSFNKENLL